VSYTYYDDGDVSNPFGKLRAGITVKDEDPNGTSDPAYDRHRDLALYYNADKSLRVALWDSWELNQYGNPTDYDPNYAHEFRYDGPLARYADAFYDELYAGQDPNRWPLDQTVSWSEHTGGTIYNDGQLTREEDPNNPGEFLFDFTEQLHYIGPQAQESVATGDLRYSHGDLIDSAMLTTDDYGAAASSVRYTAFGEILDANGSPGGEPPTGFPRYQYAGGWGYESGLLKLYAVNPDLPPITLQHVGARWYQPDIGRFVQRDPIGIAGGLNVYAYCANHPTLLVDPEGEGHWVLIIIAGIAIWIFVKGCVTATKKGVSVLKKLRQIQEAAEADPDPNKTPQRVKDWINQCMEAYKHIPGAIPSGPPGLPTGPEDLGGILINEGAQRGGYYD